MLDTSTINIPMINVLWGIYTLNFVIGKTDRP